jgi:hypothetical protein
MRRTGCSLVERGQGGYFVPDGRLTPEVGRHFTPGSSGVMPALKQKGSAPDPCPFWAQPVNRRGLVERDDASDVPSPGLSVSGCARRGSRSGSGLPPFVPCTAPRGLSGPLEWDTLSQDHLLGGNRTHTVVELSEAHRPLRLIPASWGCGCQPTNRTVCSFLYGSAARAAFALGYRRIGTYTLPDEGGASLRAVGWQLVGPRGGGSWSREGRPRADQHPLQPKLLWERTKSVN